MKLKLFRCLIASLNYHFFPLFQNSFAEKDKKREHDPNTGGTQASIT